MAEGREQAATAENKRLSATVGALQQQLRALETALAPPAKRPRQPRDEAQRAHEDLNHLRRTLDLVERREQAVAAENHGLSASGAELEQQLGALESALIAAREEAETARAEAQCGHEELIHLRHMLELADRRKQAAVAEGDASLATAVALEQQLSAVESALNASREEAETVRDEARRQQEDLIRLRHLLELADRREQATAAENHGLSAAGAELLQQLGALETALTAARLEAETVRDETHRERHDLVRLRQDLERMQRLEQATAAENRTLGEQIRTHRIESERERQLVEAERLEFGQRLAALQAELESREAHWQAVLEETRRVSLDELRELRRENQRGCTEAELVRRERDLARSELEGLAQDQELLAHTLAMVEAAHEMAQEQSRAELRGGMRSS